MGSVEGLYAQDNFYFDANEIFIKDLHFLAVEEVKKLGVGFIIQFYILELSL